MYMATMATTLIDSNPIWAKKSVKGPHMTKNRVHSPHGQPVDYDMDDYVHTTSTS
jgi:hypothetical protein